MKVYVVNYNGVLDGVIEHYAKKNQLTSNYHEADAFVLWQDVRGHMKELAEIAIQRLGKPVIVMQHGRGATRDYLPPNKFKAISDMYLLWGETEKERMLSAGVPEEKLKVVGCPLFPSLRPKAKKSGKNVLFVPVIAEKEHPENLLVYAKLKEWESKKLFKSISEKFKKLKESWLVENIEMREAKNGDKVEDRVWKKAITNNVPRHITYDHLLNVKLTPVHDAFQYMSPVIRTSQGDSNHIPDLVDMLTNIDLMVCLEEGTMQLLAHALDIPVILVDIFNYGTYGGTSNYDVIEKIKTNACYVVKNLDKLEKAVDHALSNPSELRKHKIAVCEQEGGANLGDINGNIISAIESSTKGQLCSITI